MKKLLAIFMMLLTASAFAFTPPKVINVTIGYPPGASGNEVSFRAIAAIIEKNNPDIHFIITNKPGADEIVALNGFAKQPTDGSQLFVASYAIMATSEVLYPYLLNLNPMDLSLITTIAKSPLGVIAGPNSKTTTPKELLDRLKNTKEPINIGLGVRGHAIVYEHIMEKSGADRKLVQPVVYGNLTEMMKDVAGGRIEFGIMPSGVAYPLHKAGKVHIIALTSERKLPQLPEVQLWKDNGLPELNVYGHWMIALPPGTNENIVKYYQDLFVPAIRSKEAEEFFNNNLMLTFPNEQSPEGVRKFMTGFRNYWIPYARKINLN